MNFLKRKPKMESIRIDKIGQDILVIAGTFTFDGIVESIDFRNSLIGIPQVTLTIVEKHWSPSGTP